MVCYSQLMGNDQWLGDWTVSYKIPEVRPVFLLLICYVHKDLSESSFWLSICFFNSHIHLAPWGSFTVCVCTMPQAVRYGCTRRTNIYRCPINHSCRNGELEGTLEVVELDETGSSVAKPCLPDVCLNIFFKTLAKEIPHF